MFAPGGNSVEDEEYAEEKFSFENRFFNSSKGETELSALNENETPSYKLIESSNLQFVIRTQEQTFDPLYQIKAIYSMSSFTQENSKSEEHEATAQTYYTQNEFSDEALQKTHQEQPKFFNSYHSITDLLEGDIDCLNESEQNQKRLHQKYFKSAISKLNTALDSYFFSTADRPFGRLTLNKLFGENCLTYGDSKLKDVVENSDLLSSKEKTAILEDFKKCQVLTDFLNCIFQDLPNEVSFELTFLFFKLYSMLRKSQSPTKTRVPQLFFDPNIRFLNMRCANTQKQSSEIEICFQELTMQIVLIIKELSAKGLQKMKDRKSSDGSNCSCLKRIKFFQSREQFLDSSENQENQELLFLPKKRPHIGN